MSASPELDLSIALVEQLSKIQKVGVRRIYNAQHELENLTKLSEIFVIPSSMETELGTRANTDGDIVIQVAYVHKVKDTLDLTEMDAYMRTLGELKALWLTEDGELRDRELAGATFKSLNNSPLWEPDLLRKAKLFFGRLSLTYWFES